MCLAAFTHQQHQKGNDPGIDSFQFHGNRCWLAKAYYKHASTCAPASPAVQSLFQQEKWNTALGYCDNSYCDITGNDPPKEDLVLQYWKKDTESPYHPYPEA